MICCDLTIMGSFGQQIPTRIDLIVTEGEGSVNTLRQRAQHDPVVKVEDDDHRPVTGAVVVFTLPISGPSGEFGNGSRSLTVTTDKDGLAAARGLKANDLSGKVQILVSASYRGLRSRALVNQFNMASSITGQKRGGGGSKLWIIVAVAGAAAAGGAFAAIHKGSTAPGTPTVAPPAAIGITPGSGSLSPPH